LYNVEPEYYRSRVDQLKATGLGELDAQAQADQEVETGEFLNWFKDDQKDKFC
jgi:ferritin